jgi:hypothetical protein
MCDACYRNDCARCQGCWHDIEHDFSDRTQPDDGYEADRAADRYERHYDRLWGDAA